MRLTIPYLICCDAMRSSAAKQRQNEREEKLTPVSGIRDSWIVGINCNLLSQPAQIEVAILATPGPLYHKLCVVGSHV